MASAAPRLIWLVSTVLLAGCVLYREPPIERYRAEDSIAGYEEFLREYPGTGDGDRTFARDRIDTLQFEPYRSRDTVAAYEEFLERFPDTADERREVAQKRIAELEADALARVQAERRVEAERREQQVREEMLAIVLAAVLRNPRGDSVETVASSLAARAKRLKKGEFESTQEHKSRIDSAARSAILPGKSFDSFLAFRLPTRALLASYDADTETLVVDVCGFSHSPVRKPYQAGFTLQRSVRGKRSYVGTNALGARVEVDATDAVEHAVGFVSFDGFLVKRGAFSACVARTFRIQIPRTSAKETKGALATYVVGKLTPPYLYEGVDYLAPTFDAPIEDETQEKVVVLDWERVWLVDLASRRLLSEFSAPKR